MSWTREGSPGSRTRFQITDRETRSRTGWVPSRWQGSTGNLAVQVMSDFFVMGQMALPAIARFLAIMVELRCAGMTEGASHSRVGRKLIILGDDQTRPSRPSASGHPFLPGRDIGSRFSSSPLHLQSSRDGDRPCMLRPLAKRGAESFAPRGMRHTVHGAAWTDQNGLSSPRPSPRRGHFPPTGICSWGS